MTEFDVFISCRKTDDDGQPTRDSLLAKDIYDFFSTRGLRPFLSEESLLTVGQSEYKRVIDDVLDTVPILVVVATSVENLESRWVKYEWDSFYNDILSSMKRGSLFSYLDGVDFKALPRTLRQNQAIQHSDQSLQLLYSHVTAALGFRRVEDMARNGQEAVDRFNRLIEVMAESRVLELEITSGMFGMMLSPEQHARMQGHIDALRSVLREKTDE